MKINSIKTYMTGGTNTVNTNFKSSNPFTNNTVGADTFQLSSPKTDKTSFGGFFFKTQTKEEEEADKLSKDINFKVIDIMQEHKRTKKRAKDQAEKFNTLMTNGALVLGQSVELTDDRVFKADDKSYDAFTYYAKRCPTIDIELHVNKGRPVKFIQRAIVAEGIDEEVFNYSKNGFRYTEKIKSKSGKKIRTLKKCDIYYGNGIGKNTYMERNDDGTFSTYIYQGPKRSFTKKIDFFDPFRENVWTEYGTRTPNLASRPSSSL